jgi:hypothetical protein
LVRLKSDEEFVRAIFRHRHTPRSYGIVVDGSCGIEYEILRVAWIEDEKIEIISSRWVEHVPLNARKD